MRRCFAAIAMLGLLIMPAAAQAVTVPASIPADCTSSTQDALNTFFQNLPNGTAASPTVVEFPTNGCYRITNRIEVWRKSHVTIDGNGSTFRNEHPNNSCASASDPRGSGNHSNWVIVRGTSIRIKDMNQRGRFRPPAKGELMPLIPSDQLDGRPAGTRYSRGQEYVGDIALENKTGQPCDGNQFNGGVAVMGGIDVWVTDMNIRQTFGDGVLTGMAHFIDGASDETQEMDHPRNTHFKRLDIATTARHPVSPSQGDGLWIEDGLYDDSFYWGMDAEIDNFNSVGLQRLRNVHVLRNTFLSSAFSHLAVPVPIDDWTSGFEIRNNVFRGPVDNYCWGSVVFDSYPMNTRTIRDVVVENNTFDGISGAMVDLRNVIGGSVQNNKSVNYVERGCGGDYGVSGPPPYVYFRTDSSPGVSGVTVANNGPNAPGADLTPPSDTPPPPPPPPAACGDSQDNDGDGKVDMADPGCSSTSDTDETDATPPPACAAPTNVSTTRTASDKATVSWTHTGGTSYTVWAQRSDWSSHIEYSTATTGSPRTLFGLAAGMPYRVHVIAKCGTATSAASVDVLVSATVGESNSSGSTTPPPPPPSCAAPTGLTGTRTPPSGGFSNADLGWNSVTGAGSYKVFIRWTASGNEFGEYATFSTNSGRIFSLRSDKSYDIVVRAVCGSTISPMSSVLVLGI